MGNRAVITTSTDPESPAIYLHWNGGRASVEAFLDAARDHGFAGPETHHIDLLAAFIASRFFGDVVGSSIYREPYGQCDVDNGDHGVYVLSGDFYIVGRLYRAQPEEIDPDKYADIYKHMVAGRVSPGPRREHA
jgi:hypothetical protein